MTKKPAVFFRRKARALLPLIAAVALGALLTWIWGLRLDALLDADAIEADAQRSLDGLIADMNRLTRSLGRRARPGDLEAPYLSPMLDNPIGTDRDLQYRMMNLIADRAELADIWLYFPEDGRFLTRYRAYAGAGALLQDYDLPDVALEPLISRAEAWRVYFPARLIRSADVMETQIAFGVADRFALGRERVVIMLFYDREALIDQLLPDAVRAYGRVELSNAAGEALLAHQADYAGRRSGEAFDLSAARSGGLFLRASLPADYAGAALQDFIRRMLWLAGLLALAVPALFALALRVEEQPLRRLVNEWTAQDGDGADDVYAVVRDLFRERQQAVTQLGQYYALLRASGIERLLNSTALSEARCVQLKNQIGGFPERFLVGYGSIDAGGARSIDEGDLDVVMMVGQLEAALPAGRIVYMMEGARFLLILPIEDEQQARVELEQALRVINQRMELSLNVALSDGCDSLAQVSAAYEQARLRHLSRDRVRTADEEVYAAEPFMMQGLLSLYQHLGRGEAQEARALMRRLFFQRGLDEVSFEQRYHALSMILTMAARAADTGAAPPALPRYQPMRPLKEVLGWLLQGVETVCARTLDRQQRRDDNRRQALLQYVKAHYTDPGLYAATLAEKFDFSEKYIYVVFKEQTGEGPASYIQRLRLQHAARLLLETELTVQQIAEDVGFQNINTYNKAFKRHYGVNSSQYRESPPD